MAARWTDLFRQARLGARFLARDPLLAAALLAVAALSVLYSTPWLSVDARNAIADVHADILLLSLAFAAVVRRYRSATATSPRFWRLVAAWLISGFSSSPTPPGSRFLQKPFALTELIGAVDEMLAA